jgi:hypothetical protein
MEGELDHQLAANILNELCSFYISHQVGTSNTVYQITILQKAE